MIFASEADKALMTELLAVLDEEIALLNTQRSELEALASAIVQRDDERLGKLLVKMEQTQQDQQAVDVKLDALRSTLAAKLGCRPEEMKLSRLIEQLSEADRLGVDYRRQQVVLLVKQLRSKHMETALLLMESARINHLLLKSLFPHSEPVTTYSTDGAKSWRPDAGLLDAEL